MPTTIMALFRLDQKGNGETLTQNNIATVFQVFCKNNHALSRSETGLFPVVFGFTFCFSISDVQKHTLQLPTSTIPAKETTYHCKLEALPNDRDYHVIALEPIINSDALHHIDVYGCTDQGNNLQQKTFDHQEGKTDPTGNKRKIHLHFRTAKLQPRSPIQEWSRLSRFSIHVLFNTDRSVDGGISWVLHVWRELRISHWQIDIQTSSCGGMYGNGHCLKETMSLFCDHHA